MFPMSRPSGYPTRSLSRAFVAVLALLLSAVGGIRFGLDRLGGLDEEPALVAALSTAEQALGGLDSPAAATQAACVRASGAAWVHLARQRPPCDSAGTLSAPTQRQGSAGGPRAP